MITRNSNLMFSTCNSFLLVFDNVEIDDHQTLRASRGYRAHINLLDAARVDIVNVRINHLRTLYGGGMDW